MGKLTNFLKSEFKAISVFFFSAFSYGMVFLFSDLQMEYYFLGLKILLFAMLLYLLNRWFAYKRKLGLKSRIERLEAENKALRDQIIGERKELEEYFLLWIHQIKTPITVSKLLLQSEAEKNFEKLKTQLFYIEEYSNMAMNYLKLKNRQSDMDICRVNLDALIRPILKKYSMLFISKRIALNYSPISNNVISDSKWLSILLEQIISNALKYTEKGEISISYLEAEKALKIKDTGIGIRSEDMKKIFDLGYSGFNGRLNEKSSGVGLYLVKKISELINVKIEVTSELNSGSEFSIVFKD